MKYIKALIILLLTIQLFAQENFPRVEKVIVKDKLFHGQIDKYPITIYLKFNQYSNYHSGVYSVSGWYFYDKVKTKIPLTGLYNYPDLILYNFNDTSKSNVLLNFREMKSNHWDDIEFYENLEGYKEKFVLSDNENYWLNSSEKLEVNLNKSDLAVQNVSEFLILDSITAFDLHNFGDWTWNFELAAYTSGKILLSYEHGSRLYAMGNCGAGLEKGFILLEFDQINKLKQYYEFTFESCNGSISIEGIEKLNQHKTIYKCYDYINEKTYDLEVDFKELTVEKKE